MPAKQQLSNIGKLLEQKEFRLIQHLLFWAASYWVLLHIFAYNVSFSKADFIYTALFHLSLLGLVYINLYLLIERFISRGKLKSYLVGIPLLIGGAMLVNQFTFTFLSDWLFPGYYFIAYYNWLDLFYFHLVYWLVSSLVKFGKSWFQLTVTKQQLEALQKEKLQAELTALRAQVNPHFLFNSLNSIYSMSIAGDVETPTVVLKLSALLRYMLYETQAERTPLAKELELIQAYVDLQRLRTEEDVAIEYIYEQPDESLMIAPLLLFPLVENAFKFGVLGCRNQPFIRIMPKLDGQSFELAISNAKGEPDLSLAGNSGGIGLANVRRRLLLIYPDKHELTIHETKDVFRLELKMEL